MGHNPQESLLVENTINTMGTLLGVHSIVPWHMIHRKFLTNLAIEKGFRPLHLEQNSEKTVDWPTPKASRNPLNMFIKKRNIYNKNFGRRNCSFYINVVWWFFSCGLRLFFQLTWQMLSFFLRHVSFASTLEPCQNKNVSRDDISIKKRYHTNLRKMPCRGPTVDTVHGEKKSRENTQSMQRKTWTLWEKLTINA